MGGDLSPRTLESAYSQGIFPWPVAQDYELSSMDVIPVWKLFATTKLCGSPELKKFPLLWFCPPQRGVLFFEDFKIPKSTRRIFKKKVFELTLNRDFERVIESCAEVSRGEGTWILPDIVEAYKKLHYRQKAVSVEAWCRGELVGGLYGVLVKGVFSGESMFFKKSEASKLCLVYLVEHLKSLGHRWIDIQMVTPVTEQFGGRLIPRKAFLNLLKARQKQWSGSSTD